jgi:hypothetical protein
MDARSLEAEMMSDDKLREPMRSTEALLRGIAAAEAAGVGRGDPDAWRMIARELDGDDEERIAAFLTFVDRMWDHATITARDPVTGVDSPVRIPGPHAVDRN